MKLYIDVSNEIVDGESSDVLAYPSRDLLRCYGGCRELSKTEGYFVFAETDDSYLLSDYYLMGATSNLVGWVNKKNVIITTAYGLRPIKDICAYLKPDDIGDLEECIVIRGGEEWCRTSVRIPIIERINDPRGDYLKVILPQSLTTTSYTSVDSRRFGYIPANQEIAEDIWMTSDNLDMWISFLADMKGLTDVTDSNIREAFVNSLDNFLERIVVESGQYRDVMLSDILQKKGHLPVRKDSPLFRYTLNSLSDPEEVPLCEIRRLVNWISNVYQILVIVRHGQLRPVIEKSEYPDICPTAKKIPNIDRVASEELGHGMSYEYSFHRAIMYWVPSEFMP